MRGGRARARAAELTKATAGRLATQSPTGEARGGGRGAQGQAPGGGEPADDSAGGFGRAWRQDSRGTERPRRLQSQGPPRRAHVQTAVAMSHGALCGPCFFFGNHLRM